MNKKAFIIISISILITSSISCKLTKGKEYESMDSLAKEVVGYIQEGKYEEWKAIVIQKNKFINDIFPHTTEGKNKNISGKDFYRIFIHNRRIYSISYRMRIYKEAIIQYEGVGKAAKVLQQGPYKFHKWVPVYLMVSGEGKKPKQIKDSRILGVVVEKDGKFQLLNVFKN